MQNNKSVTSEMISFLRFPLAVIVVIIHCFFPIKGWRYDQLAAQGLGSNVTAELLLSGRILVTFVVILFFLISGYLFFVHLQKWDHKVWKQKMSRRIWTLLIPYFLWNTLYIIYCIGPDIAGCIIHGNPFYFSAKPLTRQRTDGFVRRKNKRCADGRRTSLTGG